MLTRQRGFAATLIIYGIAALAALGMIYGAYKWVDTSWETSAGIKRGEANVQAKWDAAIVEQRKKEQEATDKATTKLETGNVKAKVVYRTIVRNVDKYIDRPVYRNACFDTDGLRDANAALLGTLAPASKPDAGVPRPDAPR